MSAQAEKAFDIGLDFAAKYGAELIVLSVARPPDPPVMVETEAMLESATEYFNEAFKKLEVKTTAAGVRPRFEIKIGHPAEQIVLMAEKEKADLIVMGSRGRSRVAQWLLGSISRRVLSYAHCSVLIVK
jgi:nucleotide-binding universal stress UspA family protein